jgi:NAD(P)-dependent dehydrogenase (short-subunit alcohol dehydrogenase family)
MPKRVYLVAGASSGIGKAAALHLGTLDGHVIVAARRNEACKKIAEQIEKAGGCASAHKFDGTNPQSVAKLFKWIRDEFGRLDGAFNNLGDTLGEGPLHEMTQDRWRASMAVNLDAVFHLMRGEIPLMLESGDGAIVNNSSTGGLRGTRGMADYSAAKWGLIGLTKSAAIEYAAQGLCINAIAPGITETEKFQEFEKNMPELFDALREETPIGRFGDMDEIARTVAWLLREAPGYLNGTVIPIDGGRTA